MMPNLRVERLKSLIETLELYFEKSSLFQEEIKLTVATNPTVKFELQIRIERDIMPAIRRYQLEFCDIVRGILSEIATDVYHEDLAKSQLAIEQLMTYIQQDPAEVELLKAIISEMRKIIRKLHP